MKRLQPAAMSVEQLTERFIEICVAQDEALLWDRIGQYNKLYGEMVAITEEMKSRPGDARRALFPLYDHDNWQVCLMAAHATLALDPERGRRLLEETS